jgi:hypothetical protein
MARWLIENYSSGHEKKGGKAFDPFMQIIFEVNYYISGIDQIACADMSPDLPFLSSDSEAEPMLKYTIN